jgi:alkylation response protein AidB-like acyl-CoA dehydrogenase
MAIDFTFTKAQRELQLQSRKFARDVLVGATACEALPTPEERFLATKPIYEAMVAAGYLRKCIPAPAGGDGVGLVDMAILAEEFYSVNPSITLTMLGTVLGLLPILLGGTPEQYGRLLVPFLKTRGVPLAGFCFSEPGGSAICRTDPDALADSIHPIIEHQAVGYALDDAKILMESARSLTWRACHALDTRSPGAEELATQAKIYGSETAVRVITELMRVVGIESYDHETPFGRLLRDALALPIFDGGNMGVRRRQLHAMLAMRPSQHCGGNTSKSGWGAITLGFCLPPG